MVYLKYKESRIKELEVLTKKNIPFIAKTYLCSGVIESKYKCLKFMNKTKRTYHFKLNDNIKISIPIKALEEFEEKYR